MVVELLGKMLAKSVDQIVERSAGRIPRALAAFYARLVRVHRARSLLSLPPLRAPFFAHPLCVFVVVPLSLQYAYKEGHESWSTAPELAPSAIDAILVRCTASPGTPCDSTVRLQAAYEAAFHAAHGAFEGRLSTRTRRLEELTAAMGRGGEGGSGATPAALEALSGVYRALLEYCSVFVCLDGAASGARPAPGSVGADGQPLETAAFLAACARETAAAVDSVFPRSALAGFSALAPEARVAQAQEVALLSLGVRLLAWVQGRGGAGLENTPARALMEARALAEEVGAAAKGAASACDAYVDVFAAASGACGAGAAAAVRGAMAVSGAGGAPAEAGGWPSELANRRVVAALALGLAGDVDARLSALEAAHAQWGATVGALGELTSGRASVAKEAIYPHFAALAVAFLTAAESRAAVAADAAVWAAMAPFLPAAACTLPPSVVQAAQAALGWTARSRSAASLPLPPLAGDGEGAPASERAEVTALSDAPPALLNAPVELQGFCPVALCSAVPPPLGDGAPGRLGLLVPGDQAQGIYTWRGRLFLVSSQAAGELFAASPERYVQCAGVLARGAAPDLLHALQLVLRRDAAAGHCPEANLQLLCRFGGDLGAAADAAASEEAAAAANGGAAPAATALGGGGGGAPTPAAATLLPGVRLGRTGVPVADAGTATPTHFTDRYVDPRYAFSQWTLRRRALQMARLRGCTTTSAQTDASHFRRDNDAQAAPPTTEGTQTNTSVGVATDKERPQVLRVRGVVEPVVQAAAERKARGLPAMPL